VRNRTLSCARTHTLEFATDSAAVLSTAPHHTNETHQNWLWCNRHSIVCVYLPVQAAVAAFAVQKQSIAYDVKAILCHMKSASMPAEALARSRARAALRAATLPLVVDIISFLISSNADLELQPQREWALLVSFPSIKSRGQRDWPCHVYEYARVPIATQRRYTNSTASTRYSVNRQSIGSLSKCPSISRACLLSGLHAMRSPPSYTSGLRLSVARS